MTVGEVKVPWDHARAPHCSALVVRLFLFFCAPLVSVFRCFRPWVPAALALSGCPPLVPPPPPFFLRASLASVVSLFPALSALGLGALWLPPPSFGFFMVFLFFFASFVSPFPLLPASGALALCACLPLPLLFFCGILCVKRCFLFWCFLWCCVVSWCAASSSLVRRVVLRCVGFVGFACCLPPPPCCCPCRPACCCCLVRFGALSWGAVPCFSATPPVLRCAVVCVVSCCVALCCFVSAGWCRVLLPVISGCLLLGAAVPCCLVVVCFVVGVPAWLRGLLPCCSLWFVVVPCSPVVCPLVFCFRVVLCCGALLSVLLCCWCLFVLWSVLGRGARLPRCAACAVSFVAPSAVFCGSSRAALCCALPACLVASLCCAASLLLCWSGPVVLPVVSGCLSPGPVVRCCFLAARCGVGGPGAALLCAAVRRGALLPDAVSSGAVLPCGAVLSGFAGAGWCPAVCIALLVVFVCYRFVLKPLQNL